MDPKVQLFSIGVTLETAKEILGIFYFDKMLKMLF
jgi:hypothetical protein